MALLGRKKPERFTPRSQFLMRGRCPPFLLPILSVMKGGFCRPSATSDCPNRSRKREGSRCSWNVKALIWFQSDSICWAASSDWSAGRRSNGPRCKPRRKANASCLASFPVSVVSTISVAFSRESSRPANRRSRFSPSARCRDSANIIPAGPSTSGRRDVRT